MTFGALSGLVRTTLSVILLSVLLACGGGGGGGTTPTVNSNGPPPPPPVPASHWSAATRVTDQVSANQAPINFSEFGVTADPAGNLFLIYSWTQQNLTSAVSIFQRQVGAAWSGPQPLAPYVPIPTYVQGYFQPQVYSDDSGNAVASWCYQDNSNPSATPRSQVFVANYDAGSGWKPPFQLQNDLSAYAYRVESKAESDGRAWVVWLERTSGGLFLSVTDTYAVFAAGYSPQTGWGLPEKISDDFSDIVSAKVALDGNGNPTMVWLRSEFPSLTQTLYHTVRSSAGTWSPSVVVTESLVIPGVTHTVTGVTFDVAVDQDGNAIVAWLQGLDDPIALAAQGVYARRYTPIGGLEDITPLMQKGPDDGAYGMQLAMDNQGNAFVAWQQFDGIMAYGIWVARFDSAAGWVDLEVISSPSTLLGSHDPKIGFDQFGNATAIWNKYDSFVNRTVVMANRYDRNTGWGHDETISGGTGVVYYSGLAVSKGGKATAVWAEEETSDGSSPALIRFWNSTFSP